MSPAWRWLAAGFVAWALLFARRAGATEPSACVDTLNPGAKDAALAQFRAGLEKLAANQPSDALTLFEHAYCAYPTPKLFRAISEAQLDLGQCGPAILTTQRWETEAKSDELSALREWRGRLQKGCATITISVQPADASLSVDGERYSLTQGKWTGTLRTGSHEALVEAAGFGAIHSRILVAAENALPQEISLVATQEPKSSPSLVVVPIRPLAERPSHAPRTPSSPSSKATAPPASHAGAAAPDAGPSMHLELWIPAGLVLVATIVGATEGALVERCSKTAATIPDLQAAGQCQSSHAVIANAGWGVAGISAVAGATLWLVLRHHAPDSTGHALQLGPSGNGVMLSGRF